jgi:hypothetical protein
MTSRPESGEEGYAPLARRIAYEAGGREDVLLKLLRECGALLLRRGLPRTSSMYGHPFYEKQLTIRFPDGTQGYYAPGGPSALVTYRFTEGSAPGDESLEGARP